MDHTVYMCVYIHITFLIHFYHCHYNYYLFFKHCIIYIKLDYLFLNVKEKGGGGDNRI